MLMGLCLVATQPLTPAKGSYHEAYLVDFSNVGLSSDSVGTGDNAFYWNSQMGYINADTIAGKTFGYAWSQVWCELSDDYTEDFSVFLRDRDEVGWQLRVDSVSWLLLDDGNQYEYILAKINVYHSGSTLVKSQTLVSYTNTFSFRGSSPHTFPFDTYTASTPGYYTFKLYLATYAYDPDGDDESTKSRAGMSFSLDLGDPGWSGLKVWWGD